MNFDDSSKKSFSELLLPFKTAFSRYWRYAWAPGIAVFLLVTVLSIRLPDYFVSDVKIIMEQQKISSKIVDTPQKEEQERRFEALVQELLSRVRLRSILDKFDLYPEYKGIIGREKALLKLVSDLEIESDVFQGKTSDQTFKIKYRHENAQTAYEVTKAIANLLIEESIISKRSETQGTEEFLKGQLRDVRKRLETTEGRVQQFIRNNAGKLPGHRSEAMARLRSAQSQLATNSQLMAANLGRMDFLQKELNNTTRVITALSPSAPSGSGSTQGQLDPAAELAQLESALTVLRSRYSDRHPDVINTTKRIQMLRQQLKRDGGSGDPSSSPLSAARAHLSPEARMLRDELNKLQVQTAALEQENEELKRTIEQLDSDIKSMPLKEQELVEIQRDYDNAKEMYDKLKVAEEEASLQSSLVRSQKSSQFKIVDPPSVPPIPAGPPRLIIAAVGLLLGIAVFAGLPLVIFFINGSFKFREETEAELGIPVIGVIPPMKTPALATLRRKAAAASLFASGLSVIAGSAIIVVLTL